MFEETYVQQGTNAPILAARLSSSAQGLDGHLGGDLVAGDCARRVDLPHLPVRVLVVLLVALQLQVDTTLSPELAAIVVANPSLVDVEGARGAAVVEGGEIPRTVRLGAVVVLEAVEEVLKLVGLPAAHSAVVAGRVLQGEVDVTPRVLVSRSGECVGSMEVKVVDGPVGDLDGLVGASLVGVGGRHSDSSASQESGSQSLVHFWKSWVYCEVEYESEVQDV